MEWDFNSKDTQNQQYQKGENQLLNSEHKSSFQSDTNNIAQKWDLTRISLLSQENLTSSSSVYQKYLKENHKNNHLYLIAGDKEKNLSNLIIYDTDSEKERVIEIDEYNNQIINTGTCIAPLPNGHLFCFGSRRYSKIGMTIFIDKDQIHQLPSVAGMHIILSSAIYYDNSVYCFGGIRVDTCLNRFTFSMRFDLHEKNWFQLSPIPESAINCTSAIFNGNILISNPQSVNIWLYSINIDSFSIIPYEFNSIMKVMATAEEQLYLIECGKHWLIYESGIGDEFDWNLMSTWPSFDIDQVCCAYNRGTIYIGSVKNRFQLNRQRYYYKFNLNEKVLREHNQSKKSRKCIIL